MRALFVPASGRESGSTADEDASEVSGSRDFSLPQRIATDTDDAYVRVGRSDQKESEQDASTELCSA
ncbi:MAG: hypothetical protein U5L04_12285 [Trueperaceae bacterium]|nr:hypothetical protein [Trueperaceae bacterium]